MYTKAKLSVSLTAEAESDYFPCNIGARQGEHLSPLLFSIYLQDLKSFISRKCNGLKHIENMQKNILMGKLWHTVNLYADGTVILAGNPNDLQASLNEMEKKCDTFNLHINANKTKIVYYENTILTSVNIYGTEVWGSENCDILEILQRRFLKYVLSVNKLTSSMMAYGDLGALPLDIDIKSRMLLTYKIAFRR